VEQLEGPLARELREISEGERDFPATTARRHHFVPAFSLANFAEPRTRKGFLFQLETATGKPQKTTPNSTAFERDLYTSETKEGRELVVEAFLSVVEKHAAPALRRLIERPLEGSAEDRQTISYFLAFQYNRTPVALEHSMATSRAMMEMFFGVKVSDPEGFRETYRAAIEAPATDEEIERFRKRMIEQLESGAINFDNPKAQAFQMMLGTADDVARSIFGMEWLLLKAADGEFVSADRPLAMHDPTPKFPWSGHAWLSSPNAETSYPISPRHCLLVRPGSASISVRSIPIQGIREMNLRTYGWAARYIYGRTQKVVTDVRRDAKQHPELVIEPRRPAPVVLEEADPDDPTVGVEHAKRGWPRGVWHDDPNGEPRFMAYTLLDARVPGSVPAALAGRNAGQRVKQRAARERGTRQGIGSNKGRKRNR
jgi:Protein of unknown function (DUF4238)